MASNYDEKRCKIIIVGAGMAGLSAATHLVKNNMKDFIVLEARKRIGGRIISIEVESHKVELGANWIHGVLGNPMYEMAMSHGLIDIVNIPKPHKVVAATEDGKQVPFQLLQEIYEAYSCFLHRCEEYFLCQYEPPAGISSVGEHIALEMEMYLEGMEGEARRIRQLIFNCLLKRETCISGCTSMADIDLLELGSYTELQGGNIALPAGYSCILEPVSRHLPADSLYLDHAVATIDWTSSTHSPSPSPGPSDNDSDDSDRTVTGDRDCCSSAANVKVTCENGATFVAEHVICTIPLGVLKEKASKLFTPPLPDYKSESIDRLLFGTVDKIFLAYERPFLNPDISEIMLLWDVEDSVDKDDLSETWYKKIYSFSKVSETLLLGWVSGREAEYMESLPQQQVADTCTCILRKFLNDPFVPKPKLCVRTKWFGEPNTRGSYTAMAVGASQADIERIARPLYVHTRSRNQHPKPLVAFAGEHTHTNFYSTVHGAFLTGRSAAQTLLTAEHESQQLQLQSATAADEEPTPTIVECDAADTTDLSSWIRGIALD